VQKLKLKFLFILLGVNLMIRLTLDFLLLLLLIIFPILFFTYKKYYHKAKPLFFLFLFLALYFGGRFITEFWKDLQGPIENLPITMGQLLSSIPLAIALIYFAGYGKWRKA